MKLALLPLAVLAVAVIAAPARADNGNDWVLRFGFATVSPKSDNGTLAGAKASVDSSVRPSIDLEYMLSPNLGIDALGALPFSHEVKLAGVGKVAKTKQLPPTLGINYHFMPDAVVSPFLGVGVNFTKFYDTKGTGALRGASVDIDNSWGPAVRAGLDYHLSQAWLVTADLRWARIRGDVHVAGNYVGQARIDPMVYGLSAGYRF